MLNNKKYLSQLNEIEIATGDLVKKEHAVKTAWAKELMDFIDVNRFKDKRCYIIVNDKRYFAVDNVRSCIMLYGGGMGTFGEPAKNVVGGVYLTGFSFVPYSETNDIIYHTFGIEKLVDITDDIRLVSKEEFKNELEKTISSLFILTEENIEKQYEKFPTDLEHLITYCPELNRDECEKMLIELENKEEQTDTIW